MTSNLPATKRSSLDTRAKAAGDAGGRTRASEARRKQPLSLLWWIFLANGAVLVVALLLLTFTPIEIHAPIKTGQAALLLAGFVALLALNLVLLRRVLSPLFRLTDAMRPVDPDHTGRRLSVADRRSAEGQALARAFNAMLDRLESARREAARTALAAQEAERLRVARELHDEIGQTLTAVTIQAERAADADPELASQALRQVADAVRGSLDEVRRIARELRPEALDDLGLVNALIALCTRVDAQGGPRVRRELQGKLPVLSPDIELVVYRIAQEGLTNALRHSDARSVTLVLSTDAETLAVRIADDGRGMPTNLPGGTAGIAGMRERALLVGGRLAIESRPGQGTDVRFEVPIDRKGE
jgi:two-component system, NarL family, sensor histidine kinase UhpB